MQTTLHGTTHRRQLLGAYIYGAPFAKPAGFVCADMHKSTSTGIWLFVRIETSKDWINDGA